jgi:hypothetical protein
MPQYEVYDARSSQLFSDSSIFTADTGRKALQQYLEKIKFSQRVKASSSNDVTFKVSPVCFENGRMYYDRRGGRRALWYKVIP